MRQETIKLPDDKRPWYYNRFVLWVVFILGWPIPPVIPPVLWPVWAVLILRSPWHRNIWLGALAWAMLFSVGYMVMLNLLERDQTSYRALATIAPGLALTVVTQTAWARRKRELLDAQQREMAAASSPSPDGDTPPSSPDASLRQRRRRRSVRHGRSGNNQ